MPRQNRVTPFGDLVAVPARGTLMGNRGCLHDEEGRIVRPYMGQRWLICVLAFKGRRRALMLPGRYTELFFLDEATALAAGHRPCAECQRARFNLFRTCWAVANPEMAGGPSPPAHVIDAALHLERWSPRLGKGTYPANVDSLPDGGFVVLPDTGHASLVLGNKLLRWSPAGYDQAVRRPLAVIVQVLTPRSLVRALAAGYPVEIHASAREL